VVLVLFCTFLGAAAQVFMKLGANQLPAMSVSTAFSNLPSLAANLPLLAGVSLYGMFTVALLFALRDGELSILYPVIALNYVWVTVLSMILFKETMNGFKATGIGTIVLGVVILGRSARR
jgi:multidrug transporter EmrE-like cation transporter